MTLESGLMALYLLALSGLSLYGCLGLFTLWLFWRHRRDVAPRPSFSPADLPPVTVQLPLYNERYVVDRLIRAAARLRYPPGRLQIQVIDDSTDDTTDRAARLVEQYRQAGVDIELLHREQRPGYKAGALAAALPKARGDLIAIFDADFRPEPDFLYQTVPHFLDDPQLGVVQTRWGHLNDGDSPLTAAQALALDKHFAVEQFVRFRAGLFPKFNGTAGVWRRVCIEDVGGWQSDTVCEDLCLSTRAVLRGWRFHFLPDVVAPAELPAGIRAYKNQQARWAKGSTQCLLKFGRAILTSGRHSWTARLYALLSMSAYATSLCLILLLLLQLPILALDVRFPAEMMVFSIAGLGQPLLFLLSQQTLYRAWWRRLPRFPALFLTAVGLSVTLARSVLHALIGGDNRFVRTPKSGDRGRAAGYQLPLDWTTIAEGTLALYAAAGLVLAVLRRNPGPAFFLALCVLGYAYVAGLSLRDSFREIDADLKFFEVSTKFFDKMLDILNRSV